MPALHRILVVASDPVLRDILTEQFPSVADLAARISDGWSGGREALAEEAFDLILADMHLADMSGAEFVSLARRDGFRGPVIVLAPPSDDPEVGDALGPGASEFVAKPFRFSLLLARIRAQLRAHEASEEAAVSIGPYTFRAGPKTLTSEASGLLRLTEKETAILRYLYRSAEGCVSRDILLQEVWGYNPSVTTHTLETHIYRLRQKLETEPSGASVLVTEPGGYRLMP